MDKEVVWLAPWLEQAVDASQDRNTSEVETRQLCLMYLDSEGQGSRAVRAPGFQATAQIGHDVGSSCCLAGSFRSFQTGGPRHKPSVLVFWSLFLCLIKFSKRNSSNYC